MKGDHIMVAFSYRRWSVQETLYDINIGVEKVGSPARRDQMGSGKNSQASSGLPAQIYEEFIKELGKRSVFKSKDLKKLNTLLDQGKLTSHSEISEYLDLILSESK